MLHSIINNIIRFCNDFYNYMMSEFVGLKIQIPKNDFVETVPLFSSYEDDMALVNGISIIQPSAPRIPVKRPLFMHFDSHYLHIDSFYNNKRSFETDNTYYGKTFLANTKNIYYKLLPAEPCPHDIYHIPNRDQFIQSLANKKDTDIIVQIIIIDNSTIYVDHDNSLCVNNVYCKEVEKLNIMKSFWYNIPKNNNNITISPSPPNKRSKVK